MKHFYAVLALLACSMFFTHVFAQNISENIKPIEQHIHILETLVKNGNIENLAEARQQFCPKNFTPREIDGLVNDQSYFWYVPVPLVDSSYRVKLNELCDPSMQYNEFGGAIHEVKSLKKVTLKTSPCACIGGFEGDWTEVQTTTYPPKDSHGKFSCSLLKYHVECLNYGKDNINVLDCPIQCVSYK